MVISCIKNTSDPFSSHFHPYETRAVEWSIGHPPKLWSWGCGTESGRGKRNVANVDWRFLAGWKPFQKSGWYFCLGHIGNQWSYWLIWLIWFGKIVGHLVVGALLKVPWFPLEGSTILSFKGSICQVRSQQQTLSPKSAWQSTKNPHDHHHHPPPWTLCKSPWLNGFHQPMAKQPAGPVSASQRTVSKTCSPWPDGSSHITMASESGLWLYPPKWHLIIGKIWENAWFYHVLPVENSWTFSQAAHLRTHRRTRIPHDDSRRFAWPKHIFLSPQHGVDGFYWKNFYYMVLDGFIYGLK